MLVLTLRGPYDRGNNSGMLAMGILASIFLAIGLLPPYWEAWKRNGRIIGINWIFISVDFSGAFFSLMALVAQQTFDVLGGVLYVICLILEGGIFVSHILWRIRTRKLRKKAKDEGVDFDDMPEAAKYQCDTDRIARNRLKEDENAMRQPSQPMLQTPTIHGGAVVTSSADTVHGPDNTTTKEKAIARSIDDRASPFPSSNAPTEVGQSDEDDTTDLESGLRRNNRKMLTVDTTPKRPQNPTTSPNDTTPGENPTSAAADSFQTASEDKASPTSPDDNDEELDRERRRGFRRTWVLVQSRGERQAHELRSPASGHTLRSPASVGQDLRSPASKKSLRNHGSKNSLRSPASVGHGLRGAISMASVRNAMGFGGRRPSEPRKLDDEVEQGAENKEAKEVPSLPTPTTPAWMREVEAQSPRTLGGHRNEGEYQPSTPATPRQHPMDDDLPSPTTPHTAAADDNPLPRTPPAQRDLPRTSDSMTPTQQRPKSEG